uniref:Uncharacterized protein n=1 Tax=Panagrolaimus davidi TaxID=227884 RepID=A0A914QTZ6_9BILA
MSNDNNRNRGQPGGEDDARALFNALDPAIQNLLIEEARRRDAPQGPPDDDWDIQPLPSTSHGSSQASSTRAPFQAPLPRGNFQLSTSHGSFQASTTRAPFQASLPRGNFQLSTSHGSFQASTTRAPFQASLPRGNFQASATRGNFQHSSSRGNFQHSSSLGSFEDGYYIPLSYSRGNDPMADDGQRSSYGENPTRGRFYMLPSTSSAGGRGAFSSSSAARRSSTMGMIFL